MLKRKPCIALTILLLAVAVVRAQESKEEVPTPTATFTDTPSLTPTETLLPTDTPTLTETLTETATLTLTTTETPTNSETPTATTEAYTPTETPTAQTATETLTPSLTPTSGNELPLIYAENFDGDNDFPEWMRDIIHVLEMTSSGRAMHFRPGVQKLPLIYDMADMVLQAQIAVSNGAARLSVRHQAGGGYSVLLRSDGQMGLYRGEGLLGTAAIPAFTPGQFYTVRFSAIANQLSVSVGGVEILTYTDPAPLPAGGIFFANDLPDIGDFFIDDLFLWGTLVERPPSPSFGGGSAPEILLGSGVNGKIAFEHIQQLFIVNPDGTGLTRMTNTGTAHDPAWSPDSSQIAFYGDVISGVTGIYGINADGSDLHLMVNTPTCPIFPGSFYQLTWSPDGSKVAYACGTATGPISIADAQTGAVLQQFQHGAVKHPAWSPVDEDKIAFVTNVIYGNADFRIWVADVSTNPPTYQEISNGQVGAENPDWSPDGQWFIYNRAGGGLRLVAASGGSEYVLSTAWDFEPSWSADGTKITFRRGRETIDAGDIWTADISTNPVSLSNLVNLSAIIANIPNVTNFGAFNEFRPDWGDDVLPTPTPTFTPSATFTLTPTATATDCTSSGLAAMSQSEGTPVCQVPTPTSTFTPSPTSTPTRIPTLTPTQQPTGCPIAFEHAFGVREKGNRSGFKLLDQTVQGQQYTAYFKSPESLDGEIWVQIQATPQIKGWILAKEGSGFNYVTSSTLPCFNSLTVYQGNFPPGWEQIGRIENTEVPPQGGILAYLYLEGQQDPSLLIARLAIAESLSGSELGTMVQDRSEVELVSWTVRMRAFFGAINYNPFGTVRTLQVPSGTVTAISSGRAGDTSSIVEEIVLSNLNAATSQNPISTVNYSKPQYQPITEIVSLGFPSQVTGSLAAAFYPRDVFAIEDLYDAYQRTNIILNIDWSFYNLSIRGLDSFFGQGGLVSLSSRRDHPDGYEALLGASPNSQNSFYDFYDPDNYFFAECVQNGLGLNSVVFPGGSFPFSDPFGDGFFVSDFPDPIVCQ